MTIQNSTASRQFINGTLPLDAMELSYGNTEAILESGVDSAVAAYDGTKPLFAAIQGNMNESTIQPTAFLGVRNHYANNANVVFVRGDHYFELMSQANAPPQHRLFTGDVNGDGKTDAFFYYGGNGDEWLGLSDGTQLTWSKAGNIAGFGNLLDGSHQLFTGDFNGDGKTDFAFYYAGNGSVWLGTSSGTAFGWAQISTATNGDWLDGKHRVSVADYDGDGRSDFFVYNEGDGSTWLGILGRRRGHLEFGGARWAASGTCSTARHAFLDGDFDGDG